VLRIGDEWCTMTEKTGPLNPWFHKNLECSDFPLAEVMQGYLLISSAMCCLSGETCVIILAQGLGGMQLKEERRTCLIGCSLLFCSCFHVDAVYAVYARYGSVGSRKHLGAQDAASGQRREDRTSTSSSASFAGCLTVVFHCHASYKDAAC